MTTSATSSELRIANRRKVLFTVYEHSEVSKQNISYELAMSLPTVTQNLKELEAMGLIDRHGLYESTGGRKAQIYHFVSTARIAIGVVLLKESYRIVAVDLYGQVLNSVIISVPFSRTSAYFKQLGANIHEFIAGLPYASEQILGIAIAIQGLVSIDGTTVIYGEILNCTGLTLDEIQRYIDFPCILIHDTEASAIAEIWAQGDLNDAILLSLTRNFGGALIINGEVHRGHELSSSIIEHMRLYPGGNPCYCGKNGCIEAYCSANALQLAAGEPLEKFFSAMRAGSPDRIGIWNNYLQDLAMAINNIRMLIDTEFIIGGYVQQFMEDQDFMILSQYIEQECSFESTPVHLRRSLFTDDSAAPGAAISLVKLYLNSL